MIKSLLQLLSSKLVSYFGIEEGRHGKEETRSRSNVNEEYKEALRSKSYTDICNQVEQQLVPNLDEPSSVHLFIEPHQETLLSISGNSKYPHFLENYFTISQEAGRICESILQNLHQVRINYHTITNVVKLIENSPDYTKWTQNQCNWLFNILASFSVRTNPFAAMTPRIFEDLRDSHVQLLHQLNASQFTKTRKRTKLMRWIGRAAIWKKQAESKDVEELDIAARGVYALIKDFELVSLLVKVLRDEMEHNKCVAERCVAEINEAAKTRRRKNERVLKEVSTEFKMRAYYCFQEQLKELEQQTYLSFLDINRPRKLLLQELMHNSS